MVIRRIKLQNFRNYDDAEFVLSDGVNMLCGENAQGKTNLLESVYLLSNIRLFRSNQKKEAIRFGKDYAVVMAEFFAKSRELTIEIRLYSHKRLEIFVNGVKQKKHGEVSGLLQSVLFCPDDLYLIREGASERRRFLDTALCQLRPRYAGYLAEYNRLLEHKTRILRDSEEYPSLLLTLDDFSERMAQIGSQIIRFRAYYIKALAEKASAIHAAIAGGGEQLEALYKTVSTVSDALAPASQIAEQLREHALSHRAAEISACTCLSGPHKDDLLLSINGDLIKNFGSQGQTRTCALSLKLAERDMFFDDSGEYPVLLLDDVLSELDKKRQDFVLNKINGGQVIITCCEEEKLAQITCGKSFFIEQGKLIKTC